MAHVYYTQTANPPSALWRLPTSGGQPVKIAEGVVSRAFVALEKGIYYIDQPTVEARLQFFDFAAGRSTTVARNLGEVRMGLTTSPDGRTILYSRVDSSVDDLMLVENFREWLFRKEVRVEDLVERERACGRERLVGQLSLSNCLHHRHGKYLRQLLP